MDDERVGRDEDGSLGHQGEPEVLEFGSARQRARWWPARVVVAVLVVVLAGVAVARGHQARSRPRGRARHAVQVIDTGHRLLGLPRGWHLLGLGPGDLVDIRPGDGRIIQTAVSLDSTGPVSLVAGPGQAVIRPLDFVPGYLVRSGRPPQGLPPPLSHGGEYVVPGPRAGQVWIVPASGRRMSLYSLTARVTTMSVPLPRGNWLAAPDGRGDVLLQTTQGSSYDAGPGGARPVTTGMVAAVGPAGWLVVQCRAGGPCAKVLISPVSGARRTLPGNPVATDGSAGVISPDGATAALYVSGAGGHDLLQLVSLASGRITTLPVTVAGPLGSRALVWSPDSRWLFTVAENGQLHAIDTRTGLVHGLGVRLPPITDLAPGTGPAA
jgi:hypothetical protein